MTDLKILVVPPSHIDFAWQDGAGQLAEVCALVDEVTESQLKLILSRGERTLAQLTEDGEIVGWVCWVISNLPNKRVLHVTGIVAHNAQSERFFPNLNEIAVLCGCSGIRYSAHPAQARLNRMKAKALGMEVKDLYVTYEVPVTREAGVK
jgi:hypothetical protein